MSDWQSMETSPKDGTVITLLIHHRTRAYCKTDAERAQWTQEVAAKWIDHNGGGWTWRGMAGNPVGWRAAQSGSSPSEDK